MSSQAKQGVMPTHAHQPKPAEQPLRKANAWWRKAGKKKTKRWTYVISEGEVYVLRQSKDKVATYWVHSDEVPGLDPANDPVFKNSEQ